MFANPFAGEGCVVNGAATLKCIPDLLPIIITLAIIFAFIVSLVLIIYSGIKFITSGGDEKQVEGARKTLTYSIAGLILVLASFFIIQFIAKQTGVDCLTTFSFDGCGGPTSSQPGSGSGTVCQRDSDCERGSCISGNCVGGGV